MSLETPNAKLHHISSSQDVSCDFTTTISKEKRSEDEMPESPPIWQRIPRLEDYMIFSPPPACTSTRTDNTSRKKKREATATGPQTDVHLDEEISDEEYRCGSNRKTAAGEEFHLPHFLSSPSLSSDREYLSEICKSQCLQDIISLLLPDAHHHKQPPPSPDLSTSKQRLQLYNELLLSTMEKKKEENTKAGEGSPLSFFSSYGRLSFWMEGFFQLLCSPENLVCFCKTVGWEESNSMEHPFVETIPPRQVSSDLQQQIEQVTCLILQLHCEALRNNGFASPTALMGIVKEVTRLTKDVAELEIKEEEARSMPEREAEERQKSRQAALPNNDVLRLSTSLLLWWMMELGIRPPHSTWRFPVDEVCSHSQSSHCFAPQSSLRHAARNKESTPKEEKIMSVNAAVVVGSTIEAERSSEGKNKPRNIWANLVSEVKESIEEEAVNYLDCQRRIEALQFCYRQLQDLVNSIQLMQWHLDRLVSSLS